MSFKTIGKKIIVKQFVAEERSKGGIIFAEASKEKPDKGTVVNIGEEVKTMVEGDVVFFTKYSGTEVEIEDEKYLVLKEDNVLVIL